MTTFTVTTDCGTERQFESRAAANDGVQTHESLCDACDAGDIEVDVATGQTNPPASAPDGGAPAGDTASVGSAGDAEPVDSAADSPADLPDEMPPSVQTDPLDVIPEYMIDYVEGQPAINKRGYAVIANRFDIVVQSEAITPAGETDHEYAEFKATAWPKDDGPEAGYTGHATARADEDRRGMASNLNEMAETRAMKRAVAWASGVGILAWEEVAGYADE